MNIDFSTLHPIGSVVLDNCIISKQNPDTQSLCAVTVGYFGVAAKLIPLDGAAVSYLVKIRALGEDKDRTVILSGQDIHNKAKVTSSLCAQGLIITDDKLFHAVMKESLVLCLQTGTSLTMINRTGWFADRRAYSTGSKIICKDDGISSRFILGEGVSQSMQAAGTLEQWQEHVLTPCINNPFLLTAGMISLSTLTLGISGVSSKWVNWFGTHGKGKTTMLQVAASYFGNGIDPGHASPDMGSEQYISKMNASQAGIEATLGGHFHRPFIADELGEGSRLDLGKLVYMASGNKGTITATSSRRVAMTHTWQTNACSAGEVSIADRISEKGEVMGGQLDRAIDIPTTRPIFFDIGSAPSEAAFAGHLKEACGKYYGTAAEFLIKWMIEHPDAFQSAQKMYLQEIQDRLMPAECDDGAKRAVQFFVNATLTGFLAIDSGLLPCTQEHVMNSFEGIVSLWWSYRKTTSPAERLAMMLVENVDKVVETPPPLDYQKDSIYFDERNDRYCLDPTLFETLIPGCTKAWIKSLVEKKFLVADENNQGRFTKRYFYPRNQARCFIAINAQSINRELQLLVDEDLGEEVPARDRSSPRVIDEEDD